jgi:Uma2 family endonuclease
MPTEIEAALLAEFQYYGITLPPGEQLTLPTQDDLPYDDGIPMETPRHASQMHLLIEALQLHLQPQRDCFIGGNMFVYYSLNQVRNQDFRGPDFFVVLDVPQRERKSWVMWEENNRLPNVIIELMSPSTADNDREEKKLIYQNQLRIPEYFLFEPFFYEWSGFRLQEGVYQPIPMDASGQMLSQELGLVLRRWEGCYEEIEANWIRWALPDGTLLPIQKELTEQANQRADEEKQRADRLAERLRAMGIEPNDL